MRCLSWRNNITNNSSKIFTSRHIKCNTENIEQVLHLSIEKTDIESRKIVDLLVISH